MQNTASKELGTSQSNHLPLPTLICGTCWQLHRIWLEMVDNRCFRHLLKAALRLQCFTTLLFSVLCKIFFLQNSSDLLNYCAAHFINRKHKQNVSSLEPQQLVVIDFISTLNKIKS